LLAQSPNPPFRRLSRSLVCPAKGSPQLDEDDKVLFIATQYFQKELRPSSRSKPAPSANQRQNFVCVSEGFGSQEAGDSAYELAGERGYGIVIPPLLPMKRRVPRSIFNAYRAPSTTASLISSGLIGAISMKIGTLPNARRQTSLGFLKSNASVLLANEGRDGAKGEAGRIRLRLLCAGPSGASVSMPYDAMIANDVVWVAHQ
jgi:hypothetical protein